MIGKEQFMKRTRFLRWLFFLTIGVCTITIILKLALSNTMQYASTEALSKMYMEHQENFQETVAMVSDLWQDSKNQQALIVLSTESSFNPDVYAAAKEWNEIYFLFDVPYPETFYQLLYQVVMPLFTETGLQSIYVTENSVRFLFDLDYGMASNLIYMQTADETPRQGTQSTMKEILSLDGRWYAVISHD